MARFTVKPCVSKVSTPSSTYKTWGGALGGARRKAKAHKKCFVIQVANHVTAKCTGARCTVLRKYKGYARGDTL